MEIELLLQLKNQEILHPVDYKIIKITMKLLECKRGVMDSIIFKVPLIITITKLFQLYLVACPQMNLVNTTTNINPKKLQKVAIILLKAKKHNKYLLIQMASSLEMAKRN